MRRLPRVDRRALTLIAAASLVLAVPAWANASVDEADALLAQSNTGTLTAQGIAAGEDTGTLSEDPKPSGSGSTGSASGASSTGTGASADELPVHRQRSEDHPAARLRGAPRRSGPAAAHRRRTRLLSGLAAVAARTTHSPQETAAMAVAFAAQLTVGDLILLEGDLGAGKTTSRGRSAPSSAFTGR